MMLSANTNTAVLTNEELINKIPMAFATEPTAQMSDRYVFIPTTTILEDMANLGWKPVLATGKGKRANAKKKSSYHMIAFENDTNPVYTITNGAEYKKVDVLSNEEMEELVVMDSIPTDANEKSPKFIFVNGEYFKLTPIPEAKVRIIVTNSHDGTSSFGFHIGIFRLICENGLVISTKTFTEIKVRHIHYNFEELRKVVATATEQIPHEIEAFNAMQKREMKVEEASELAVNALKIRKGMELTDNLSVDEEIISELLVPKRDADKGNDLWSIYNVLQEKIIKGGSIISVDGKKPRKMRGIKSAIKDLTINKRLFETAYAYVETAEAA